MPFLLPGLNNVTGRQIKEISGWICDEEFQVYSPVGQDAFTLFVDHKGPLLNGYAAEITRISSAAFETIASIARIDPFKKSTAWLIIKTYYAAFFAAHSIMRMLGISCSPIGRAQLKSIDKIASAYGYPVQYSPRGGLYKMAFDTVGKQLNGSYIKSISSGPHEAFWNLFHDRLKKLIEEILVEATLTTEEQQQASTKIEEILFNLSFGGAPRANWLSMVRNAVNYGQETSTWYPYQNRRKYFDELFSYVSEWRLDSSGIDLASHDDRDLRRFQATCNFLVSMCRELNQEMAKRCSAGRSFHDLGCLAFLNLLEQPR
jgi:hypothetical protein